MIVSFADAVTEGLWTNGRSRKIPANMTRVALRKLAQIHFAARLDDLRAPPGNHLEALVGDRRGQYSIRINDQWRICFEWEDKNVKRKIHRGAAWNLHPGEILREEFLKPIEMSSYKLAKNLRVPVPRIHDIVLEKRGITADTAVRLARFFGTSPEFWMNAQSFYEVRRAQNELADELSRIEPRVA